MDQIKSNKIKIAKINKHIAILTTPLRARTIGRANALITNPIVRNIDTSWQELAPLEYEFCVYRREINVGITENT